MSQPTWHISNFFIEREPSLFSVRPMHSNQSFRKRSTFPLSSYFPAIQWHPKRARTCFEGPFGEVIRATGPMAKANPFRFSTKYQDDETDLVMYPARPYSPWLGRWLSRDPIEERGDRNIYAFVRNAPIAGYDALGKISVFPASGLTLQPCGGFNMDWAISLDSPAPAAGYVVQEVTINYSATTCDRRKITDSFTYWEAFPVEAKPNSNDRFRWWGRLLALPCESQYQGLGHDECTSKVLCWGPGG
jgi:RHS repeat-associated protein